MQSRAEKKFFELVKIIAMFFFAVVLLTPMTNSFWRDIKVHFSPPVIKEIYEYRKTHRGTFIDVTEIAKKHLSEKNWNVVYKQLSEQGFTIKEITDKRKFENDKYDRGFVATWDLRYGILTYGFGDIINIGFYLNGNEIKEISAKIVNYHM